MAVGGQNTSWKHGTNGAISTNTDFSAKMRAVAPSFEAEEVESTTFGDAYRDYEQSFKNGSFDATYKYDTTVFGQLAAIFNAGDTVTFEFGPDGTTSGRPKITGSMVMTSFNTGVGIGDLIEIEITWRISGAPTFTTFA